MPEDLPEPAPTFRTKPVSFVRRSGRMSEAQERAWSELAPFYLFDVPRDVASTSVHADARLVPADVYRREAPLTVEIGSGQGHAIVAAATAHPERDFLAVEVFRAGLARTMLDADRAGARNLRLVEANAPEVLETLLPEASADEVWVFFPDPWHKSRHNKRRLVKEGFGAIAGRALRDGGVLRLATDWEDYALQMREVLDAEPEFERAFDGDWAPRFDGRVMTAFERKGLNKGREIRDLAYRRVARV
ncbi:tRNA (guanosine(46)-N7)-methyltransferase TrmB [Microbacterium paludicola]|uniref:tRNA (guanine-N(7)-)-methyltransferase n=1 Tax=Microbacterium paludicola TaxID=300019 RepID=A0A4Y9FT58_9MICO|nr:tRNA (guanosine(46)-N7)-methyltransferase TrmB [Microbacterium paludicola]MBF0816872.1 tRNA (guanosine(46)-N7)-methyltransferase TrmB [Microbacterium paludicola]TFU32464.1 tRNA (guanosine(46)-N7)-methyltransferase TrmB [Microbacterium paludicola]